MREYESDREKERYSWREQKSPRKKKEKKIREARDRGIVLYLLFETNEKKNRSA